MGFSRGRGLRNRRIASTGLIGMAALLPLPAFAQEAIPTAPPTREEITREPTQTPPSAPSRLSVEGDVERAPCPLADPQFANVRVTFSGAQFNNLTAVSPDVLRPAWEEFAGKEVSIATVCEIRDRAGTMLRNMGYLAAVQVPPQRIEPNGTVVFDVLMAKLVGIQVRGDAGQSEKLIAAHLNALTKEPVFNSKQAERHLLLARDLPGYDVRLVLRPANTAPGEVIGEVQVSQERVRFDVNIQNLGTKAVGRFGALARLQMNDLTGMGDTTSVGVFKTIDWNEQTVLQLGHSFAIGSSGLRFSGEFAYAWTNPDIPGGIDVTSDTLIATLGLSYPFIRRQASNLSGTFGLDIVDQDVVVNREQVIKDRLRVLFARLDYEMIDPRSLSGRNGYAINAPRWRLTAGAEARLGLDGLGASEPCGAGFINCRAPNRPISDIEADPQAFVLRANAYAEYRPVPDIAFSLAPRGQYSSKPLLNYEEYSGGSYTVGRGYDPGSIRGDSGIGFSAEMRYGRLAPSSPDALAFQPFVFFDGVWAWNEEISARGTNPQKLFSAGGGVHAAWGNRARLDLTLAVPLQKLPGESQLQDARVLMSFTTQLFPWSL